MVKDNVAIAYLHPQTVTCLPAVMLIRHSNQNLACLLLQSLATLRMRNEVQIWG